MIIRSKKFNRFDQHLIERKTITLDEIFTSFRPNYKSIIMLSCGSRILIHALSLDGELAFYLKNDFIY